MSELEASTAAFKVLVSGSGWSVEKGTGADSWASFLHERDRLFDFVLQGAPRLIYRLFDFQGRSIWEPFGLYASELANGVRSWPEKVDEDERERQNNYDAGRGYYEKTP